MLAASIPKAMRARKGRRVERESCIVVESGVVVMGLRLCVCRKKRGGMVEWLREGW